MAFGAEYRAQLASHDRHWKWKVGFRVLIVIFDLVAIALAAFAIIEASKLSNSNYGFSLTILPFDYIPLGVSLIWCLVALPIHLARKRPVHPGVEVGIDLLLWLSFAILAAFTLLAGILGVLDYSSYSSSTASGGVATAANGSSTYVQEAQLKAQTNSSLNAELATGVLLVLNFILHFTVFVWACVETSKRNSKKAHRQAKDIAQAMIAEMVASGQLPPPQQPLLFQFPSQVGSPPETRENSVYTPSAAYSNLGHAVTGFYGPLQSPPIGQGGPQASQHMPQPSPHSLVSPILPPQAGQWTDKGKGPFTPQAAIGPMAAANTQYDRSRQLGSDLHRTRSEGQQIESDLQRTRSEGESPRTGNGASNANSAGWHTPTSQLSDAERAIVDDSSRIKPTTPARAPGHTYRGFSMVGLAH